MANHIFTIIKVLTSIAFAFSQATTYVREETCLRLAFLGVTENTFTSAFKTEHEFNPGQT